MAEKKQYLNQNLEAGSLLINEDVLETIVVNAIKEVEGVAGFSSRPAMDVIDIIGKKNIGKALKIIVVQDNEVHVNCNINVLYGRSVVNTANNVQTAIKSALESSANISVATVNVNVCGIVRK